MLTFRDHEVWDLVGAHSFWVAAGHIEWEPPFRIMITDNPSQDTCSDQLFWLMFSGLNVHAVSPKWSRTPLGRLCTGWKGFLSHPNQHTSTAHTPVCTLYYVCTLYICSILFLNQCQKGWVYHLSFYHLIFAEGNDVLELILPGSGPRSHDFQLPIEPSGYSRSPGECFSSPQSAAWGWHSTGGAAPGTPGNCKGSCLHACLGAQRLQRLPAQPPHSGTLPCHLWLQANLFTLERVTEMWTYSCLHKIPLSITTSTLEMQNWDKALQYLFENWYS